MQKINITLLEKLSLFQNLTIPELRQLSQYIDIHSFRPKTMILEQGNNNRTLYIISSGKTNVSLTLPGDIQRQITYLGPGDFFGEITLLTDRAATASIQAIEKTTCYLIKDNVIDMLYLTQPDLADKILHAIAKLAIARTEHILGKINDMATLIQKIAKHPITKPFQINQKARKTPMSSVDINKPILENFGITKDLSPIQVNRLLKTAEIFHTEAGYCIYQEKTEYTGIHIIYSGAVQLFDKSFSKITLLSPGDPCGHLSLVKGHHTFSAVSREPTILLYFSEKKLFQLKKECRSVWYNLHEFIYQKIVLFQYDIDRQLVRLEGEYGKVL